KPDPYVGPATTEVARGLATTKLNGETLLETFQQAGAKIAQGASCAACLGGPSDTFGRLNKSEVCISTTNRNFPGRMGSKTAQVYLASPYTVAASAIRGEITDPREFLCAASCCKQDAACKTRSEVKPTSSGSTSPPNRSSPQ